MNHHPIGELDHQVRYFLFLHFIETGKATSAAEVAKVLGEEIKEVESSFLKLAAEHALALAPSTLNVWMMHPFSAVATPYRVRIEKVDYWANCAWDVFGIASMLEVDSRTEARCGDCSEVITVTVKDGKLVEKEGVVHFAVPAKYFWNNVGFT